MSLSFRGAVQVRGQRANQIETLVSFFEGYSTKPTTTEEKPRQWLKMFVYTTYNIMHSYILVYASSNLAIRSLTMQPNH